MTQICALLTYFSHQVKCEGKITNRLRIINMKYPKIIKENQNMTTCNRLDLETLKQAFNQLSNQGF